MYGYIFLKNNFISPRISPHIFKCPSIPNIPWAVSASELNTSGEPSVLTSLVYQTRLLREPLSPKGLAACFQDGFRA